MMCNICSSPVTSFADDRVQIAEFKVDQQKLINKNIGKVKLPKSSMVTAIRRDTRTFVPDSDEVLHKDDHVFLLSLQEAMNEISGMFTQPAPPVRNVVIFGGGRIGSLVAEGLETQGISVMIIERDSERCHEAAARLNKGTVIQGDATDSELLIEQGVPSADAFISTTESDELNILCALLAKNLGVPRSLIILNKPGYIPLAEAIGVDIAVSPLLLVAGKIAHFVLHGGAISATFIGGQEIQAVEFAVSSSAGIAQRSLNEAGLPKGTLAVAIVRGEKIIIPPDESIIYPGDHVVIVTPVSSASSVEKLFK